MSRSNPSGSCRFSDFWLLPLLSKGDLTSKLSRGDEYLKDLFLGYEWSLLVVLKLLLTLLGSSML